MTILNPAKVEILSLLNGELDTGSLGTSNQAVSVNDEELVAEVPETILSVVGSQNGKQLITTYNLNSVTGNDETYQEYGNKLNSGVLLDRITFTGVPKNSALEFQVKNIINIL